MAAEKFNYGAYLASREWAVLKNRVQERSGGICERCRLTVARSVHHQTYERIGHEQLEDLLHVCDPCHEFLSGKSDQDPALILKQVPTEIVHGKVPEWDDLGDVGLLLCPACGSTCLHHEVVCLYEREAEDADGMRFTVRSNTRFGAETVEAKQIPGRRNSLAIGFWCEDCDDESCLQIMQHKGGTYLRWTGATGTRLKPSLVEALV